MSDSEEPNPLQPSKSQRKRDVKAITELGEKLLGIPDDQLMNIPYSEIIESDIACKRITKGNARKRQLQYLGKQLRQVDLDPIHQLIDRFDASSRDHVLHFHQLETWRELLINQDKNVMGEILDQLPDIDRQHLRQLVRNAISERAGNIDPPVHFRKLFQYLKTESAQIR